MYILLEVPPKGDITPFVDAVSVSECWNTALIKGYIMDDIRCIIREL